jgi:hypothetical protein
MIMETAPKIPEHISEIFSFILPEEHDYAWVNVRTLYDEKDEVGYSEVIIINPLSVEDKPKIYRQSNHIKNKQLLMQQHKEFKEIAIKNRVRILKDMYGV